MRYSVSHPFLVFRADTKTEAAGDLLIELGSQGVWVEASVCDITDNGTLRYILNECSGEIADCEKLHPFNAQSLFEARKFSNRSYKRCSESTQPEVAGSWDLQSP